MTTFLIVIGTIGLITVTWILLQQLATRRISRERVFQPVAGEEAAPLPDPDDALSTVGWWLFRAGYRSPDAPLFFVLATLGLFGLGLLAVLGYHRLGIQAEFLHGLGEFPSGLGDIFLPFAYAAPWILLGVLTALPALQVRGTRRRRVAAIEQDLPLTLELLATLAEAGIGFDAALDRILESQPGERPLAEELRQFQLELLAGRPRVQCLRRLGRRIHVSSLTLFISALIQASQVGSGVSDVLRRQVEELRNRRREHALTLAASLPVKLLFPLVICFLPGLFVAVLGPAFYQFFQMMDSLNRSRGRS